MRGRLSRYDARRDAVLSEANAIGTTALRARLLPAPHAAESLALLREYTQLRLDLTTRIPTPEELSAAISYVVSGQGEPMAVCEQAARSRSRFSVDSTTHNTMCELSGPPK